MSEMQAITPFNWMKLLRHGDRVEAGLRGEWVAPISVADWDLADFPDRIAEVQELYVETLRHWPHEGDPRV